MAAKPEQTKGDEREVLYMRNVLGFYLRQARENAGFSLRDLEKRCGVSDSEIFKIESGKQECRLESFVRICAALGVPGGQILDHVVSANFGVYQDVIETHPLFLKLTANYEKLRLLLSGNLAMIAAFAAHLARCSHPVLKAKLTEYPNDQMRSAFITFAEKLEATSSNLDRLSLLSSLSQNPFAELSKHGLFDSEILMSFAAAMTKEWGAQRPMMGQGLEAILGKKSPVPLWTPFLPPDRPDKKAD